MRIASKPSDGDAEHRELRLARGDELPALAAADERAFAPHAACDAEEYAALMRAGRVLVLEQDGVLQGCAQVLLEPEPLIVGDLPVGTAYCAGSFVVEAFRGDGLSRFLHRAQEQVAREAGKRVMTLTVRVDNIASLRARLREGWRVTGCSLAAMGDAKDGGSRLVMTKDLSRDGAGFDPSESGDPISLREVQLPDQDVDAAFARARELLEEGFVGVGLRLEDGKVFMVFRYGGGSPPTARVNAVRVEDECSRLRQVLLNYEMHTSDISVGSSINTTSAANIGKVDLFAQIDEYRNLVQAFEAEGVDVLRTGARTALDRHAMFPRDAAFVVGTTVVLAQMGKTKRAPEELRASWMFRGLDIIDVRRRKGAVVEGGDAVLLRPGLLALGVGQRTNALGAEVVAEGLATRGWEVLRVPHARLHLDVALTMLGAGLALVDPTAISQPTLDRLAEEGIAVIEVDPEERFGDRGQPLLACNVVALSDRRVIAAQQYPKTIERLRAADVEVVPVDLENVVRHGGGPRCATCPTVRGE